MYRSLRSESTAPDLMGSLPGAHSEKPVSIYLFAFTAGLLIISGVTAYQIRNQLRSAERSWRVRLYTEVANRAWVLSNWLEEGHDDSQMLASSPELHTLLSPQSTRGGLTRPVAAGLASSLIDNYARIYGYASISVLDSQAHVVVSSSGLVPPVGILEIVHAVVRSGKSRIDLLGESPKTSFLVFSSPVLGKRLTKPRDGYMSVIGVAVLTDPLASELVPLVTGKLSSTLTGETLLMGVTADGGVYLSPRRLPLNSTSVRDTLRLSIRSAKRNRVTLGEFDDYRGVKVMAAMEKLPGVGGVVVGKVDRREALSGFRQTARLECVVAASLVLIYAGLLAWYRRTLRAQEMREEILQQQAALTERKSAEKAILKLNEELEQRIVDRTADLATANQKLASQVEKRKEVEVALRQSEQRYRQLVENANDIIFTLDQDGKFTSLNAAGEQTLGFTRQAAMEINFSEIVPSELQEAANQIVAGRGREGSAETHEVEVVAHGGQRVSLEVSLRRTYQRGELVGTQGIARDLTERKRLEAQFRQMQKMDAIGRLAGGVAHDFNNLLTIIGGYSEVVLQNLPSGETRESAEQIRNAADRAASLTRRLLAFSRQQVVAPQLLDLNAIVTDMEMMLQRLVGEDVQLVSNLRGGLGRVIADKGQIEQVIMNLVVNSRDAMPSGGLITIETAHVNSANGFIRSVSEDSRSSYVMIAVSDTGSGMSSEVKSHLFEPFFTTKREGKGTGLGLATVYGIVKQSGGHVSFESEIRNGTTFRIYFPLALADDKNGNVDTRNTQPDMACDGSETVLLVEDEEAVRSLARLALESHGYVVLEAARASQALTLSEQHGGPIHLVLTDVVMPQMSGPELADRLAVLRPETRILYMSGYTDEAVLYRGEASDRADYIQKPFTPSALIRKVRTLLNSTK